MTEKETELLETHWEDEFTASSRLGCQVCRRRRRRNGGARRRRGGGGKIVVIIAGLVEVVGSTYSFRN